MVMERTTVASASWCRDEFRGIEFGDPRINRRFFKVAEQLSNQPSQPINQACGRWSDSKAAYRLFQNEKMESSAIRRVHALKTRERAEDYPVVIAATDKSFFNYEGHEETTGLGHIGSTTKKDSRGLIMQTALAVTPEGLPLGILDHEIWARERNPKRSKKDLRNITIENKESYHWLESLKRISNLMSGSGTSVVVVADREADIYEFIDRAHTLNAPFVVRAAWDRALVDEDLEGIGQLWSHLNQQKIAGTIEVDVPARGKKESARVANVSVSFAKVNLRRPKKVRFPVRTEVAVSLSVSAVWARELRPPKGATPLAWMLLTSVDVTDFESAVERINWYKQRWSVEIFHKIMKSGCQVEKCRLQTADRLERYLTLFSVIAWKIHALTHENRHDPKGPCSRILQPHEWQSLYCKIHRTDQPPVKPPTIREAVRMIAQLGGFLARKGDGEPGIITIWRGWQRLADISEDWLLFRRRPT